MGDSIYNVGGILDEKADAYFVENGMGRTLPYLNRF